MLLFSPVILSNNVLAYALNIIIIKVLALNGSPLKNAYVTLVIHSPSNPILGSGYTDENGIITFRLENAPDSIHLYVTWKGVIVHHSVISPYIGSITIKCKVGDISIKVLSRSLHPITNAVVILYWNTTLGMKNIRLITNEEGTVQFEKMPIIKYLIKIYINNRLTYSKFLKSSYIKPNIILLDLALLYIKVVDADGYGVSRAYILLENGKIRMNTRTNEDGEAVLKYIPYGNYTLTVSYNNIKKRFDIELDSDKNLKIKFEELCHYKLDISVYDDLGNPLDHAEITIYDSFGRRVGWGYTSSSGSFAVKLYPGIYVVRVVYWKYSKQTEITLDNNMKLKISLNTHRQEVSGGDEGEKLSYSLTYIALIFLLISIAALIAFAFHLSISRRSK